MALFLYVLLRPRYGESLLDLGQTDIMLVN